MILKRKSMVSTECGNVTDRYPREQCLSRELINKGTSRGGVRAESRGPFSNEQWKSAGCGESSQLHL